MAADILLYDADLVPVGEDQKQHLELARDIAQQRINARFGDQETPVLKVPKPLILKEGARVMSLTDGRSKMSKSDPNEGSRITLLDPPELITKKIKRAKTDPLRGLYAILSGKGREQAASECAEMGWGQFKPMLAEAAVNALEPIQVRYRELMNDPAELDQVLSTGRDKAEIVANATLERVREALGFARRA
jgi:tryptophanyl-tRNA synthetase